MVVQSGWPGLRAMSNARNSSWGKSDAIRWVEAIPPLVIQSMRRD